MRKLFLIAFYWGWIFYTFIDPFYGVLLYTFMNIIRPEQLAWGDRAFAGRIFLATQAASFISWFIHKEDLTPEYTPLPFQIKLMIFIAIAIHISGFLGIPDPSTQAKWSSQFMKMTLFCFIISKTINTAKKLEWYYILSLGWFVFLEIWGIFQKLGGNVNMEGIGGDQLSNRNDLSSVVVLYFPMAYYTLYNQKKWIKLFVGIPVTIVFTIFIIFSGSRGAFLGLLACVGFIFLRTPGVQKFKILFTLIVVGALLVAVIVPLAPEDFFDSYTERLQTLFGEEEENTGEVEYEGSAAGRLAMWKAAYYFMKQHPEFWLTGMGMKGFRTNYINYIHELEPYLDERELALIVFHGSGGKAIHNTYINMATSGGLLIFLPWMFLLFFSVFQAHQIPKKYPKFVDGVNIHNYALAIETGLLGAGINVMFINAEFVDFYYWHLAMAGVIANLGMAKLKREKIGLEDEDFIEPVATAKPVYSSFS